MTRRMFFSILLARPAEPAALRVSVLETFGTPESLVLLVHHAESIEREAFAKWLQAHPQSNVRIRTKTADDIPATIFRVRMCFGRGLIVLEKTAQIHERDILTVSL